MQIFQDLSYLLSSVEKKTCIYRVSSSTHRQERKNLLLLSTTSLYSRKDTFSDQYINANVALVFVVTRREVAAFRSSAAAHAPSLLVRLSYRRHFTPNAPRDKNSHTHLILLYS